jgi:hypothetical protein
VPTSEGEGPRSGSTVVVRTDGLTYWDRKVLKIALILSPLMFLGIVFGTAGGVGYDTWGKVTLAVGAIAFACLMPPELTSVRRVTLDDSGVIFRFLFHKERAAWAELKPSGPPALHDLWAVLREQPKYRVNPRAFTITVKQARAIMAHPNCPKWDLSPEVRQSLGLDLPPPVPPSRAPW